MATAREYCVQIDEQSDNSQLHSHLHGVLSHSSRLSLSVVRFHSSSRACSLHSCRSFGSALLFPMLTSKLFLFALVALVSQGRALPADVPDSLIPPLLLERGHPPPYGFVTTPHHGPCRPKQRTSTSTSASTAYVPPSSVFDRAQPWLGTGLRSPQMRRESC